MDFATEPTLPLVDRYMLGKPLTEGRVGWLNSEQSTKLRELWQLLLKECDKEEYIDVQFSLEQQKAKAAEASDKSEEIGSLSFEPLMTISTKEQEPKSGGWFGWGTWQQNATNTPLKSSSRASTPASTDAEKGKEDDVESEETIRQRHETVQEHLNDKGDGSAVAPVDFVPLFEQPKLKRTFRAAFWQAATQIGDPDSWVLRFLRARQWDVTKALEMIRRTIIWRVGQAIDEIAFYGESQLHNLTMNTGLAYACMEDRLGNPVYVVRVRANVARNRNILAIKRFLCWQIETSQLLTAKSDGKVTMLFDFNGFSRENIDTKLVRTLITLLTNYYPETLGIIVLNVDSWVFSSLWMVISPFIDPEVRSKIVMARNAQELAPYIDPQVLVSELGGKKQFVYEYIPPACNENTRMADIDGRRAAERKFVHSVAAYEQATRQWLDNVADSTSPSGSTSLGDSNRGDTKEALRQAAIDLDPFIRSRTLYHRFGFVNPDHSASF
ncbi:phosphatidylinositol transfer protein csr1 [Kickxella alabastrina]|uniref:Phosphatidylinositol transfer protein csr1 n=1 Tax=Kickxella alabastrina TaxID=61397 RepID=A0ACC1IH01_9FUNG|nr:phosphatidylinositol transfer protein csr1 [Kickxella alabastrina]